MEAVGEAFEGEEEIVEGNTGSFPHAQEEHGAYSESCYASDEEADVAVDAYAD